MHAVTSPQQRFHLPPLPYAYDALEPVIDAATMRVHHDAHHKAYVDNLNAALEPHPELAKLDIEELLRDLSRLPESARTAVRNHGGGHANHAAFWQVMAPGGARAPQGALAQQIDRTFGSLDRFRQAFVETGTRHFGSGWVFLTADLRDDHRLEILSLPNQDSPLSIGKAVLMLNDLWEHAYYLKYQNRRAEYLRAWFDVVDWRAVSSRFEALAARAAPRQ